MSGSPWMGVLSIGGGAAGVMLLIILLHKAERLREAINRRWRLPVTVGLMVAGLVASVLLVKVGPGSSPFLPIMLSFAILDLARDSRPRWLSLTLWLDAAVLLSVTAWIWAVRGDLLTGVADTIADLVVAAGCAWIAGQGLYRIFRPRADQPSMTDQTLSETGTPA